LGDRGAETGKVWRIVWGILLAIGLFLCGTPSQTQMEKRVGGGLQFMGSTAVNGAGPGVHLRASFPMNYELSFAVGAAVNGFVLRGGGQSAYALDLEATLVVTLPNPTPSSLYLLGGIGYHAPVGGGDRYADVAGGPTFPVGVGKVWKLGATSLYLEAVPTLFFRLDRTDVLFPLRAGIIF
jgi:hypothetical protein